MSFTSQTWICPFQDNFGGVLRPYCVLPVLRRVFCRVPTMAPPLVRGFIYEGSITYLGIEMGNWHVRQHYNKFFKKVLPPAIMSNLIKKIKKEIWKRKKKFILNFPAPRFFGQFWCLRLKKASDAKINKSPIFRKKKKQQDGQTSKIDQKAR